MDNMKEKLKNIFKEKKTIGLTVVLILLLIVSLMTYGKNKSNVFKDEYMNNIFIEENDNYNEEQKTNSSKDEIFKEDSSLIINNTNINQQVGNIIVVEINGDVINPDVYSLNEGSIIKDLIEAAGGLTNEADISNINRAKEINNHELIVIRNINDSVSNENIEINEIQEIEIDDGKININTADLNRLKDIPGIGDVKANSIIMYREENGGFKTIDELKNVDGIGEKTFEKIKRVYSNSEYEEITKILKIKNHKISNIGKGKIVVVSGGTSDIPVADEAYYTAKFLGNDVERVYDVGVAGIHRLLNKNHILQSARVVISVAGMEGALPSVVGGLVDVPVIAVPTSGGYGANFGGLSALLTMLNSCASGISVVIIDNGFGAGYLASMINKLD